MAAAILRHQLVDPNLKNKKMKHVFSKVLTGMILILSVQMVNAQTAIQSFNQYEAKEEIFELKVIQKM